MVSVFSLIMAFLFLVVIGISCIPVCNYEKYGWCLWIWLTVTFGIGVFSCVLALALRDYQEPMAELTCSAAKPIIKRFWDDFIDGRMCSEYCPCDGDALIAGG